jgi:hypothetical protein
VSHSIAMDTALTPLIGPALGFAGTCLVVGFGYYQWRKQNGNPNRASDANTQQE